MSATDESAVSDGLELEGAASAEAAPTPPHQELGRAFKGAMVAIRRMKGRETHRQSELSYAQYSLLFVLSGTCERSARDLAEPADLTAATVTQMLDGLEAAGLVKRTRSEQDRRVVLNTLTERGEAIIAERHDEMESKWRASFADFSEAELLTAARVLDRLAQYFNER